ncbi:MAG: hypothetical protein JWP67_482 [Mucilaginibacter sp.]|nr:hypothetical protein [Mucilaginibacter sp.]
MYKKKSLIQTLFLGIGLFFLSCSKQVEIQDEPVPQSTITLPTDALLASTAPVSTLATSNFMLGINGHMSDAPYMATSPVKQIQLLKELGIKWYRLNIQTKSDGSASSSTLFDALRIAAGNGGVSLLPMLYLRTLSFDKSESENYQRGKTLGSNFAVKYGRYFTYYNLGNDLELPLLLPNRTGQNPSHYKQAQFKSTAAYLKGMDDGLKLKDPDAKTMISAGWVHYGFLQMCQSYGVKFDIVGYNWYSDMEGAAAKSPINIPDITRKLAQLFPTKPIWFTEFNYRYKSGSRTNEADQSAFVTKFIAKCKSNPQVKVAILYELLNEPYKSPQESEYGIMKWLIHYTLWTKKALAKALPIR